MIELEDVSVSFGEKHVLAGLDLKIYPGETTVIVGRSGSGKTVLLKLMIGLLAPRSGRVRVFGRDLAALTAPELLAVRRRMGMVFQNYALFDSLSVEDNVEFPLLESAHVEPHVAATAAHELLEKLGLAGNEDVLPGDLSGGMKKRVSLARALVARPEIVLFDEPTTGLDPLMVEKVDALISLAKQQYGITSVVISHDMASVRRIADRVAFLHEGRILFTGSYDDLVQSDLAPIRAFLGETRSARDSTTTATTQPVIELAGVHKSFGAKHVLRGVDLAIYPGQVTALIGASGSGKSVLARHFMGLLEPDRGSVRVFGKDLRTLDARELQEVRSQFGLVFQHAGLLDWLDVEGNIAFPLVEQRRESAAVIRERVREAIDQLGLGPLRHRMPGELSAGERKRVALARAIVTRPRILIYDEPTTGQDPMRTHEIDDLITQIQQRYDVASIVISHDIPSTFHIAQRIALIHEGQIVICGTPAEVRASTNAHVRHFLASAVGATRHEACSEIRP